jgi:hypothetical protein
MQSRRRGQLLRLNPEGEKIKGKIIKIVAKRADALANRGIPDGRTTDHP